MIGRVVDANRTGTIAGPSFPSMGQVKEKTHVQSGPVAHTKGWPLSGSRSSTVYPQGGILQPRMRRKSRDNLFLLSVHPVAPRATAL
jgi:hypothetical protein